MAVKNALSIRFYHTSLQVKLCKAVYSYSLDIFKVRVHCVGKNMNF